MRLVFLGSGAFGLPTLEALHQQHDVLAVVTQPDRRAGRGGRLTPTPIGQFASDSMSCPVLKPERINEPDIVEQVRALGADAWVVIAYGQKLGEPLLQGVFAINLHASRLPRWRGAAPINAAILAGDPTTGNSVITLADRMDAGEVLGQSERTIEPDQTAGELHDLLSQDGPELVLQVLDQFASGTVAYQTQDESLVTLASKLSKADGWADFGSSAEACRRRINGLSPWPSVTATFRDQPLKLLKAVVESETGGDEQQSGRIVDPARGIVACAAGTLRLIDVQPAGKRAMAWADFARGAHVEAGEVIVGGSGSC